MKKFAIILSGCGVYDGSEIHEATLSMLAIKKAGADYDIFAPDIMQFHVINHLTGETMQESRNVLIEAARIARGQIKPLTSYNAATYDALVLPGGFGAAKNLSTYAFDGTDMKVNDLVAEKIRQTADLKKPIGALCIAPVIIAKVLSNSELTIGKDAQTAEHIVKMGGIHVETNSKGVVHDKKLNVFSTPCYMLDGDIAAVAESCEQIINKMLASLN